MSTTEQTKIEWAHWTFNPFAGASRATPVMPTCSSNWRTIDVPEIEGKERKMAEEHPLADDEALLTTADMAARYRVHKKRVAVLEAEGRIPPHLEGWTGQGHRWLKSEVNAHMRAMRRREQLEQVK